jgi:hypothetical protein
MECLLGPLATGTTARAAREARLKRLEQSTLPTEARTILASCLDLAIEARPASALDVAEALRKATNTARGGMPAEAPEPRQEDLFGAPCSAVPEGNPEF